MSKKFLGILIFSCSLVLTPLAYGKNRGKNKTQILPKAAEKNPPINHPEVIASSPYPKYKLNCQIGFNVASGSAMVSGFQFGDLIYSKFPIYTGPEINFMLFSPGSALNVLWGAWLEHHPFIDKNKSLDFGLAIGPAFANHQSNWRTTSVAVFFDSAYTQKIDDSFTLRGQIRPGVISGSFLLVLNFNVQFAFF